MYFLLKKTEKVKGVLDVKSNEGNTAGHWAVYAESLDCLNLLMERKANLLLKDNKDMSVIDEIVWKDFKEMLEIVYPIYKKDLN